MLQDGFMFFTLISLTAIIAVVSLIVFIVKRKDRSSRKIWGWLFALSLITSISLSAYGLYQVYIVITNLIPEGDGEPEEESPRVTLLKSYTADTVAVPPSFYTYFGWLDLYRYPLVYPYSITCADRPIYGFLDDERNVENISNSSDGSVSLGLYGITHLSFDKKNLLVKMSEGNAYSVDEYAVFNFETQEIISVDSEIELFEEAKRRGFEGRDSLVSLRDYDQLF